MLIQLIKVEPAPNAPVRPGEWGTYVPGSADNPESLPVGYVLEGYLLSPVEVGKCLRMLRISRNGIAALGVFESSPVTAISDSVIITQNSVYIVRLLAKSELN